MEKRAHVEDTGLYLEKDNQEVRYRMLLYLEEGIQEEGRYRMMVWWVDEGIQKVRYRILLYLEEDIQEEGRYRMMVWWVDEGIQEDM